MLLIILICSLPKESTLTFKKKTKKNYSCQHFGSEIAGALRPCLCALLGLCSPASPGSHCLSILSCFSQHTPSHLSQNRDTQWFHNLCLTFSYQKALFLMSPPPPPPRPIADSSSYCFISLSTWLFLTVCCSSLFIKHCRSFSECGDLHSQRRYPRLLWSL